MRVPTKTASRLALAFAAGLFTAAARAADLGGDCCIDLEERVAALEATAVTHGTRKMNLKISGWVNAGALYWNDHGAGTDQRDPSFHDANAGLTVVNTDTSQTRFVLEGENRIGDGVTTGFSIGIRPWGDKLSAVSQLDRDPSPDNVDIRDTYVFLDLKRLGKFELGQQASAADGAWYQDLGGSSTWIANANPNAWNASFNLRDTAGNLSDILWSDLLSEMSDSQAPRLSFYSRQVGGFQAAASVGSDTWAVALYYAQKFGSLSVSAGAGYDVSWGGAALGSQYVGNFLIDDNNTRLAKFGASASIYDSKTGLYSTVGYSSTAADLAGRNDAINLYSKFGWRRNVFHFGETNIYAESDRSSQVFANGVTASVLGAGLTQDIDATNAVLYLGYRHSHLDQAFGADLLQTPAQVACACGAVDTGLLPAQSFDAVLGGMVVQF